MVNPNDLCAQHLLGEHLEIHMLVSCINQGKKLTGYIDHGLVELDNLESRHSSLVEEMNKRGMNHKTPLQDYVIPEITGRVDVELSKLTLLYRCSNCRKRRDINE
jgi:hypothetical protein